MELSELKRRVSSAEFCAEYLREGSWQAQDAFHEVSVLEEEIASLTSAGVVEGAAARVGAVRAALRAGEPLRALSLATRYLDDVALPGDTRAELEALRQEAHSALPDGDAEVKPVRFHFVA